MNKFNNGKLILVVAAFLGGSAFADEHGHMHHKFSKDVDAFHSILFWHRFGMLVQDLNGRETPVPRLAKWLDWPTRFVRQTHRSWLLQFLR